MINDVVPSAVAVASIGADVSSAMVVFLFAFTVFTVRCLVCVAGGALRMQDWGARSSKPFVDRRKRTNDPLRNKICPSVPL